MKYLRIQLTKDLCKSSHDTGMCAYIVAKLLQMLQNILCPVFASESIQLEQLKFICMGINCDTSRIIRPQLQIIFVRRMKIIL